MDPRRLDDVLIDRILGGKYRLRESVGVGASGSVYQADQIALGRTVAVKILRPELATDERLVKRFYDEAVAASRLNHPNTVSVIDYGETRTEDGTQLLYIVMEFLRGLTLSRIIRNEGQLGDERIIDVVSQILSGLEEAHHAGVIHADLKPDNIVVERRRGGWDLVKVVDFGIARLVEKHPTKESKQTICGTPEYMAPEIIGGEDPTVASDLYAVGVILYEMLTGETPFVGGSTLDVLTRHLRQAPVPPSIRRPDRKINPMIEKFALRALSKSPADRFGTAVEFRKVIEGVRIANDSLDTEPQARCGGCGVQSSVSFKFCPECGYPLGAGNVPSPISDVVTAPLAVAQTQSAPTLLDTEARSVAASDPASPLILWPLPLVGRDAALRALTQFAGEKGGGMMVLTGDFGIGRSRLLQELYTVLDSQDDTIVYEAAPDPTGLCSPYYPIRAIIASVLQLPAVCAYDSLSTALETLGLTRRDLPGIAELFGHHGELWQLDPPVRRRELFASTTRVLRAATERSRIVLLFDDVDRYDQPSQELLLHLANPENGSPLRVIVGMTKTYMASWPADLPVVEIHAFGQAELATIAQHLAQSGHQTMPNAAELAQHTRGLASHVFHLARFVVEGGAFERAPQHVADLISERIKLVPHQALVICQTAAIFGDEVSRDILERTLGGRFEGSLDMALSVLKARGLFFETDDKAIVGFTHHLVREVVYDATPADVRRELHATAVKALSALLSDPLILGHHHALAGHLQQAAILLMRAGDEAVHQLDDRGATALYHRALDAARELMLSDDDRQHRARFVTLSVKLADALRVTGQAGLARGLVEEAQGYSDGNPSLSSQLLQALSRLYLSEHKLDVAIETLQRAIGLLIPAGEMELLAQLYLDLSSMYLRKGDSPRALEELSEGLAIVTLGEGEDAMTGPRVLWRLLLRMAQLHSANKQNAAALKLGESALIHARRVRSRIGSARVQAMLSNHYEQLGNLKLAEQYREAALNEMRRLGDRRGTAELLLAGTAPTRTLMRLSPASLREAQELADEVGWSEGVQRALDILG